MAAAYLLPLFVALDSLRSLLAFAVMRAGVRLPPAGISCLAETFKLICAVLFHIRWLKRNSIDTPIIQSLLPLRDIQQSLQTHKTWASVSQYDVQLIGQAAIPAALYLVNNILYLIALLYAPPALLATVILAKLPMTAVLHYLAFGKARCWQAWMSLAALSVGLLVLNVPWSVVANVFGTAEASMQAATESSSLAWIGAAIGLTISAISSVTSIATESLMKRKVPFWTIQVWLYLYGSVFAAVLVLLGTDSMSIVKHAKRAFGDDTPLYRHSLQAMVALATCASGLIVANILRKSDNLLKLIGGSLTAVATLLVQPFLWPDLWDETFNFATVISVSFVAGSAAAYNYYKDVPVAHDGLLSPSVPALIRLPIDTKEKEGLLSSPGSNEKEREDV